MENKPEDQDLERDQNQTSGEIEPTYEDNTPTSNSNGEPPSPRKNIWNLILGLLFVGYGAYRVYSLSGNIDDNMLGFVLGIGFIAFGFYDLWKYQKGV